MSVDWDDYLRNPLASYHECRQRCLDSFREERGIIKHLLEWTRPRAVACLGAGVLNDIPYQELLLCGAKIHLADWLPGSLDSGIEQWIIAKSQTGTPQCIYCDPKVGNPLVWCANFRQPSSPPTSVCGAFVPADNPLRCAGFRKGECPTVHYEDVTGGHASGFARGVPDMLQGVRSWRQALGRAKSLAERAKQIRQRLSIPSGSVELVTSSMVLSQFEHEPYQYFSQRAADHLGKPTRADEEHLLPAMERLRTELLVTQIHRHCEEIRRLLRPGGVCYISFELFQRRDPEGHWFLVEPMHRALEVLGRYFEFRFDVLRDRDMVGRFDGGGKPSIVCRFVLEPKAVRRSGPA